PLLPERIATCRKRGNSLNHSNGIVRRAKGQITDQAGAIHSARHQACSEKRACLGCKNETITDGRIIKRFNAERITRQKEAMPRRIPDCESKHATKLAKAFWSPF